MSGITIENPVLLAKFDRWRQQNRSGGLDCLWRRRPTWASQIIQKMGKHREVTAPLFWGENMNVVTGETVSRSLLTFGYSESALIALMLCMIRKGQVVVDIGTHFGYEAMLACHLVGEQGRVVCFEPNPAAASLALKNIGHFVQAELRQKAIADLSSTLKLQDRPICESAFNSLSDYQHTINLIEVPVVTLDEEFKDRDYSIDFLKCDVEGFELSVLQSADNILAKDAPILVLEADMPSSEGIPSARAFELATYLQKYNYQAFGFDFDGKFRYGKLDGFTAHHANVLFLPDRQLHLLDL